MRMSREERRGIRQREGGERRKKGGQKGREWEKRKME